jgi:FtsP/CotA-like multicopper oxidase with cupredoxin domain
MDYAPISHSWPARVALAGVLLLVVAFCGSAQAAVPGITGGSTTPVFNLVASADRISQPDGQMLYSWGYGCDGAPAGFAPFTPDPARGVTCPLMQIPGPTMIVHEGDTVTVNLRNGLPVAAGNTSIVFAGLNATAKGGVPGLLAQEATPAGTATNQVSYTFTASKPGTYAYYSGSQPDLQIEMGLYGVVIVLPSMTPPASCKQGPFALAVTAYDHPDTCYDREYLFQFSEMMSRIHQDAEAAVQTCTALPCPPLAVATEPYQPNYYLINGRSMPDDMDTPYAPNYPHQPYNGNPNMLPGERVLMRVVGQGRVQHPFHFHGNHARVLARDGNLLMSQSDPTRLAGPLLFTIATVSGQSVDAIFTWTGQNLNWDVYDSRNGHLCNGLATASPGFDPKTHEYCPDHGKPIPVTPPDPNILAAGLWYGGSPYLGLQGQVVNPTAPGVVRQNTDGAYAYMWHSHDEREITTANVFPGGMMMMLLIHSPLDANGNPTFIDETQ